MCIHCFFLSLASEAFNLALDSMKPYENDIGVMKESHHDIMILTVKNKMIHFALLEMSLGREK